MVAEGGPRRNLADVTPPAELTPDALAVYMYATAHPGATRDEIRDRLGLAYDEVDVALAMLTAAQLVRTAPGRPLSYVAIAPELAATGLLASLEALVSEQSRELAERRAQYLTLLPRYLDSRASSYARTAIEVIETDEEVNAALAGIVRETLKFCWCAYPGTSLSPEKIRASWKLDKELLDRGVDLRSIHQHSTRTQVGVRRYAALAIPAGGRIRTVPVVPAQVMIFDGELAILARFVDGQQRGALMIRDLGLLGYLVQNFEIIWSLAKEMTLGGDPIRRETELDDTARAVLTLLAAGHKDDFIARRIGCSVRTARRHVSNLLESLGAESRFQAGVLAARANLLD